MIQSTRGIGKSSADNRGRLDQRLRKQNTKERGTNHEKKIASCHPSRRTAGSGRVYRLRGKLQNGASRPRVYGQQLLRFHAGGSRRGDAHGAPAEPEEESAYDTVATTEAGSGAAETPEPDASVADYTEKIIYTASVSIETTEFDKAVAALESQVQKIGGFVESSNVTGDTQYNSDGTTSIVNRWAYYTVRIPCEQFEAFLHETEGFGNVISTSRDAQNVTSAYTDYEARLSSLNTQEERLLDMLSKSEDVETLIALEQRLSDVRYEIESIERSLRNYDMQIRYSTVELDLREVEVYTPTVPVRRTFGQKLSDSLSDGWTGFARGVQNVILGLASALPALVLLAVIVIAVIAGIKTTRKKRKAKFTAQQEPPQDPKP